MIQKYDCDKCKASFNEPGKAHVEYEDGGYLVCPNCGTEWITLNPLNSENQVMYARALSRVLP